MHVRSVPGASARATGEAGTSALERRRHLFADVGLDDVARLDVLEPLEADAAVEAAAHLGDVVLEAAQRGDLAFVDDAVVAQQADAGACAG